MKWTHIKQAFGGIICVPSNIAPTNAYIKTENTAPYTCAAFAASFSFFLRSVSCAFNSFLS